MLDNWISFAVSLYRNDGRGRTVLPLTGPREPHCGICKETKAWYDALVFEEIIDLVQQALELNRNSMRHILKDIGTFHWTLSVESVVLVIRRSAGRSSLRETDTVCTVALKGQIRRRHHHGDFGAGGCLGLPRHVHC